MDHNNKHVLPGFHSAFPAAFAGLQNAGTSAFMSTLSHLSGLSTPMLPSTGLGTAELAQWAAASQPAQQSWIETAKVAAMLPSLYFTEVKGIDLAQQTNLLSRGSYNLSSGRKSLDLTETTPQKAKEGSVSDAKECVRKSCESASPSNENVLSNVSSCNPSTSTPHDQDCDPVEELSLASSQATSDANVRSSPLGDGRLDCAFDECQPSTSTAGLASECPVATSRNSPRIPKSSAYSTETAPEDSWADIDVDLLNGLFDGSVSTKQKVPVTSVPTSSFLAAPPSCSTAKKTTAVRPGVSDIYEADKEFDYILNMVTERNDKVAASSFPFDFAGGGGSSGLSPIQFTPPDSPTGITEPSEVCGIDIFGSLDEAPCTSYEKPIPEMAESNKSANTAVSQKKLDPFTTSPGVSSRTPREKEPFLSKPVNKFNKVPVYKQKRSVIPPQEKNPARNETESEDAYQFEEEDDHRLSKMDPRERLDAEVREKLSRMSGQSCESRNRNIYVPGVGFAVPNEQPQQDLWRHVVPKKRPIEGNRPIIPAANLLPSSVHAEASEAAARLAEPEIVTLAESIRRRKKNRFVCQFIKTEQSVSKECTREEFADDISSELNDGTLSHPRLPKIIIKLPKRVSERYSYEKKRRKKKSKKNFEDDDSDWEGSYRVNRKKHKPGLMANTGYEIRLVEPDPICKREEEKTDLSMLSKKRRLMMQWQEGQENITKGNGSSNYEENFADRARIKKRDDFNGDAIKVRLSKFGPADGHLPKGTFVVCKSDILRDDCALWRVDNQNLLQKYPPRVDPTTKTISYKNSSTYSGWCDQIASGYYRVDVRYVKQTRSDAVIQPEIALADLFPALTSECQDTNGYTKIEEESSADANDHISLLRDPIRLALYTFTQVLIDHALTLDFLQNMKHKNDWSFLQALTEIDRINSDCMNKLRGHCKFREDFEASLNVYTQMFMTDADVSGVLCQCCVTEKKKVEKIVQLLGYCVYDRETLQTSPQNETDENTEAHLPAVEYLVCSNCATASQQYHRCYHLKYHLLIRCEDKLELIGTQNPDFSPEKIVEMAKKARSWQSQLFGDILENWRKIQNLSSVPSG